MNSNSSDLDQPPCKYCKYDGYQNRLDSACYTCCYHDDSNIFSEYRPKSKEDRKIVRGFM